MTDTITLPRSVVEQALAAFEQLVRQHYKLGTDYDNRAKALRAALEQPPVEQEPVAYFYTRSGRVVSTEATDALMQQMIGEPGRVALYAHPQPPRQPLTLEQIDEVWAATKGPRHGIRNFARAIERAHGIGGEA